MILKRKAKGVTLLQLLKYISKLKIIIIVTIISIIYSLLNTIVDKSDYSFFQHPYITIGLIIGYLFLVFPFDFQNTMFVTQFKSAGSCRIQVIIWLSVLSIVYIISVLIILACLGIALGDIVTLQKLLTFLICTLLSLVVLNVILVFFSAKWGGLFSKIFLICFLLASFALNFAGGVFIKINFLFFNINNTFSKDFILTSLLVYVVIFSMFYVLSLFKDKEI